MKLLFKIVGGILGLLAILLVVLLIARDAVIRIAAEKVVTQMSGFPLKIQSVHVGLFEPVMKITGVVLNNPADYPEPGALEVKEFSVRYDAPSFFSDRIHIQEIVVDVPKVNVVTKSDGEVNFKRLGNSFAARGQPAATNQPAPARAGPQQKFRIDRLSIRFGTLTTRNYTTANRQPVGYSLQLNLNYTLTDITDFNALRDDLGNAIDPARFLGNMGEAAGKVLGGNGVFVR